MTLYELKEQKLDTLIDGLNKGMQKKLEEYENHLNTIKHNVVLKRPLASFEITKKNLENNQVKMNQFIKRYI